MARSTPGSTGGATTTGSTGAGGTTTTTTGAASGTTTGTTGAGPRAGVRPEEQAVARKAEAASPATTSRAARTHFMRRKLYDVPASSKHEDVVRHRATRRVYPRPMVASRAHSPNATPAHVLVHVHVLVRVLVLVPLSLLLSSACSSPSSSPPDAPPSSPPDARCLFSFPDAAPPSTSRCPELPATPARLDEA
ncbi:MAG: hypothetical protein EXR73_08000, partial [Myxococcales bacterium]|nr:hypothetical protein [Myxococcales bacterium]